MKFLTQVPGGGEIRVQSKTTFAGEWVRTSVNYVLYLVITTYYYVLLRIITVNFFEYRGIIVKYGNGKTDLLPYNFVSGNSSTDSVNPPNRPRLSYNGNADLYLPWIPT